MSRKSRNNTKEKEEVKVNDGTSNGGDNRSARDYSQTRCNDISWYNRVTPLYEEATKISWNRIPGIPYKYTTPKGASYTHTLPGVATVEYISQFGNAHDYNDAVNRAFTGMMTYVTSKASNALTNMTQADLAFFGTGTSCIVGALALATRTLGLALLRSPLNWYLPRALYASMEDLVGDEDFDVFVTKLPQYRSELNQLILDFNRWRIPEFIDLYHRDWVLNLNVYTDEDPALVPGFQMYQYMLAGMWRYSDTANTLTFEKFTDKLTSGNRTFGNFLALVRGYMDDWYHSSSLAIINGTLQRAFDSASFLQLPYITETYVTIPYFEKSVSWQFQNAMVIPYQAIDAESLVVSENVTKDLLLYAPKTTTVYGARGIPMRLYKDTFFLNSYDNEQSKEFQMEATRGMYYLKPSKGEGASEVFEIFAGTHLNVGFKITRAVIDSKGATVLENFDIGATDLAVGLVTAPTDPGTNPLAPIPEFASNQEMLKVIESLSKFRFYPRIYLWGIDAQNIPTEMGVLGDVTSETTFSVHVLEALHRAAVTSMFYFEDRLR